MAREDGRREGAAGVGVGVGGEGWGGRQAASGALKPAPLVPLPLGTNVPVVGDDGEGAGQVCVGSSMSECVCVHVSAALVRVVGYGAWRAASERELEGERAGGRKEGRGRGERESE